MSINHLLTNDDQSWKNIYVNEINAKKFRVNELDVSGNLNVTGDISGGTLHIINSSYFYGSVDISNNLDISGDLSLGGGLNVNDNIVVLGDISGSTLHISGNSSLNGSLTVFNNSVITGILTVSQNIGGLQDIVSSGDLISLQNVTAGRYYKLSSSSLSTPYTFNNTNSGDSFEFLITTTLNPFSTDNLIFAVNVANQNTAISFNVCGSYYNTTGDTAEAVGIRSCSFTVQRNTGSVIQVGTTDSTNEIYGSSRTNTNFTVPSYNGSSPDGGNTGSNTNKYNVTQQVGKSGGSATQYTFIARVTVNILYIAPGGSVSFTSS